MMKSMRTFLGFLKKNQLHKLHETGLFDKNHKQKKKHRATTKQFNEFEYHRVTIA